jgi:hypothetical protein
MGIGTGLPKIPACDTGMPSGFKKYWNGMNTGIKK